MAAAVVALLVLGAVPVLAHAELVSSDPADGAQLATSPTTITLTFSEGVVANRSSFNLNQGGTTLGTGKAAADGDTEMVLDGVLLDPGDYVIRWTSVAEDGDLLRGSIRFTILEPTPAPPSPTPTEGSTNDVTPTPTAAATAEPSVAQVSPSPQATSDTAPAASSGSDVLIPIVIGLIAVGAVGAFLLRRSRRA